MEGDQTYLRLSRSPKGPADIGSNKDSGSDPEDYVIPSSSLVG